MNKIFFDTETTGFHYRQDDRIIEIAAVEFDENGKLTGREFHTYVDPGRDIPEVVVNLTGINNEKVAGAPKFADVIHEFISFIEGHEVVAHNGDSFDAPFLNFEMQRAGVPYTFWEKPGKVTDSLKIARQAFPKQKVSLDELMAKLGVDASERQAVGHNALLDCKLLAQVYYKLTAMLPEDALNAADHEVDVARAPILRLSGASIPSVVVPESELELHEKSLDILEAKAGKTPVARVATRTLNRQGPRP